MQRLCGDADAPWPADPAEIIDRYPRESRRLHRASDPAGETADDVDLTCQTTASGGGKIG